jgi:hypothetical protein
MRQNNHAITYSNDCGCDKKFLSFIDPVTGGSGLRNLGYVLIWRLSHAEDGTMEGNCRDTGTAAVFRFLRLSLGDAEYHHANGECC